MSFSVQELVARLSQRPVRARFAAGPLLVELYEEDPRLLPPMVHLEDDEDPSGAGGGLVPVLSLVWLAATERDEPQLLYRSHGWETPVRPADTYYTAAHLELQLMLRALPGVEHDHELEDYTVAGVLVLNSRMGQELAAYVQTLEPKKLVSFLKPLSKTLPPGQA